MGGTDFIMVRTDGISYSAFQKPTFKLHGDWIFIVSEEGVGVWGIKHTDITKINVYACEKAHYKYITVEINDCYKIDIVHEPEKLGPQLGEILEQVVDGFSWSDIFNEQSGESDGGQQKDRSGLSGMFRFLS